MDYKFKDTSKYNRMPADPHEGRSRRLAKAFFTSNFFKFLSAIAFLIIFSLLSNQISSILNPTLATVLVLVPVGYLLYRVYMFIFTDTESYKEWHDKKTAYLRNSKQVFLCPNCKKDAMVFTELKVDNDGFANTSFSVGGVSGSINNGGWKESDKAIYECPRCHHQEHWIVNSLDFIHFKLIPFNKNDGHQATKKISDVKKARKEQLAQLDKEDKLYKKQKRNKQ